MAAAHAPVIALMEDHGWPDPHWCARLVEEHRNGFAGVAGAMENGVDRPLNWAVYFCDFGKYQNPVAAGATALASDANVSYRRAALESIAPVWRDTFHEPSVNWALRSRGLELAISPEVVMYQHRHGLSLAGALRERFTWGRSYTASRPTGRRQKACLRHALSRASRRAAGADDGNGHPERAVHRAVLPLAVADGATYRKLVLRRVCRVCDRDDRDK